MAHRTLSNQPTEWDVPVEPGGQSLWPYAPRSVLMEKPIGDKSMTPLDRLRDRQTMVRARVQGVARSYWSGLYLFGRPGTGKSYTVTTTLADLGVGYHHTRGHLTPIGLYEVLEAHREAVIVLDDVSALFRQPTALQMLLAALEPAMDGEPRRISYVRSGKHGNREVWFSGAIIAISNVGLGQDPILDAIGDRVTTMHFDPSDDEIESQIEALAMHGDRDLNPLDCLAVASCVARERRRAQCRATLRQYASGLQALRQYRHADVPANVHWTDLVRTSIHQRPPARLLGAGGKQSEILHQREVANRICRETRDPEERLARWRRETGASARTLERRAAEARRIDRQIARSPEAT